MSTEPSSSDSLGASLFARFFSIDVRALAAFRIGLALLILVDLSFRSLYLEAHYSDAGILPRGVLNQYAGGMVGSIYMLHGSTWFAGLLFVVTAILAVMLLVGYETRLATFWCWAMVASLHSRHTNVLNGGDSLFCLLLFWSIFLPLGATASIDNLRRPRPAGAPLKVCSIATFALLMQIIVVYLCTGLKKVHPFWYSDAIALWLALHIDQFTTRFGLWVRELPFWVLKVATIVTFWFEVLGWLLVFVPFKTAFFRIVAVILFIALHVGISSMMNVGLFSATCIVAWMTFLPTEFWNWLSRLAPSRWLVGTVRGAVVRTLRIEPAAEPADGVDPITRPTPMTERWVLGAVVLLVAWYNLAGFERFEHLKLPGLIGEVTRALRLEQDWAMFSPHPPAHDGWYVVPATLVDGSQVDLYGLVDGGSFELTWDRPAYIMPTFPTQRWRKYLNNIWLEHKQRKYTEHFGNYLRNKWNSLNPPEKQIKSMAIYMFVEYTHSPGVDPMYSRELMYEWEGDDDWRVVSFDDSIANLKRKARALDKLPPTFQIRRLGPE